MKNVSSKLLKAIQQLGGSVEKTGWNSYSKYKYVTESDINKAVLPALLEQGLLLTTSVESVNEEVSTADQKNRFASVILVHKIIDTASGETLEFRSAGTGADTLDKAVYKAYTGACKYFLMKTFMLSGDDDPENDSVAAPASAPQANKGFGGKPQQAAAPALAKPAPGKGFMAKKTEAPAPSNKPNFGGGAAKPNFGRAAQVPQAQEDVQNEQESVESEQDAAF